MSSLDSKVIPMLQEILSRLSQLENKVGTGSSANGDKSSAEVSVPRSVVAFDDYTNSYIAPFVSSADKLGGEAQSSAHLVKEGFEELRKVLLMAAACKEPAQTQLPTVLAGISSKIKAASTAVKRDQWEKHTKTLSEGIGMLNWVVVKPAPRDFIETFIGASDYWANGIRKEHRTTNPDQIAFCDTFKNVIVELGKYVKEHHTTGLAWNKNGVDIASYDPSNASSSAKSTTSSSSAAEPVKASTAPTTTAAAKPAAPTANLFAELNKEGAITSGLKKVTKDMQTWRAEYKGSDAPAPAKAAPAAPVKSASAANQVKGPPKLEYQDQAAKWVVENQTSPVDIEIKDKKETVYVFGCIGATINVKGKCKSIVVDSCKKVTVYFEMAMASVEVVNSQRMNVHCLGSVPSVAIDKTDGIVVHLSPTSLATEITASKSSEMNVCFPDPNNPDETLERPIPEQYVHRLKGTTITADVSDLYSH